MTAWQAAGGQLVIQNNQMLTASDPQVLLRLAEAMALAGGAQGGRTNPAVVTGL